MKKISFTSSGLEPATFWLVVLCLNHYATECPNVLEVAKLISIITLNCQSRTWSDIAFDNSDIKRGHALFVPCTKDTQQPPANHYKLTNQVHVESIRTTVPHY
jgi:hypothetical protein